LCCSKQHDEIDFARAIEAGVPLLFAAIAALQARWADLFDAHFAQPAAELRARHGRCFLGWPSRAPVESRLK
jgi:hypothetical protein